MNSPQPQPDARMITWGEVYEGLLRSPAPERHLVQFDEFTATIDLLTPDTEVARHHARMPDLTIYQPS